MLTNEQIERQRYLLTEARLQAAEAKLAKVRDAALDCFSRGHSKCLSCGEYGEYNAPPHPKKEGCNMEDFQQHRPMLAPETVLAILQGDSK